MDNNENNTEIKIEIPENLAVSTGEVTGEPESKDIPVKKGPSKEDEAAFTFQMGVPKCIALASNMKAGAIARVYANLLQFPLVDSPKKFRSKAENDLFVMSLRVMDAKNVLMNHYAAEVEEAQKQAVVSMHEEIKDLKQQETTNGENNE